MSGRSCTMPTKFHFSRPPPAARRRYTVRTQHDHRLSTFSEIGRFPRLNPFVACGVPIERDHTPRQGGRVLLVSKVTVSLHPKVSTAGSIGLHGVLIGSIPLQSLVARGSASRRNTPRRLLLRQGSAPTQAILLQLLGQSHCRRCHPRY